jgi:hypothetical protein
VIWSVLNGQHPGQGINPGCFEGPLTNHSLRQIHRQISDGFHRRGKSSEEIASGSLFSIKQHKKDNAKLFHHSLVAVGIEWEWFLIIDIISFLPIGNRFDRRLGIIDADPRENCLTSPRRNHETSPGLQRFVSRQSSVIDLSHVRTGRCTVHEGVKLSINLWSPHPTNG